MPMIRNYIPSDEPSWLRCRVLAFLATSYFDDVWTSRPDDSQVQLVAVEGEVVVGILDLCLDGGLATIDTICVHPDHQHRGIGTALLRRALELLPEQIRTLDAWTRDDADTLRWYRSRGFTESEHYLHVHKAWDEPAGQGWTAPAPLSAPVTAFCHAPLEHEAELRRAHRRVHVCRRFSLVVAAD
ncbi:GNAT family N-acetyltransferase [Luteococcus peritonei]|uniref:GNAT family N-acetyltransferase n=1 Tax=Luteococcus peritonei TaxID=88874 RepID=A0ABW4RY78_9ACTN